MRKDLREVMPDRPDIESRQVGDVDFLDRLNEEGRLGKDLDVEKPRA